MAIFKNILKSQIMVKILSVIALVSILLNGLKYFILLDFQCITNMLIDVLPCVMFVVYVCFLKQKAKGKNIVPLVLFLISVRCFMNAVEYSSYSSNVFVYSYLFNYGFPSLLMAVIYWIMFAFLVVSIISILKDFHQNIFPTIAVALNLFISIYFSINALSIRYVVPSYFTKIFLMSVEDGRNFGQLFLCLALILYFINKKSDNEAKLLKLLKKFYSKKISEEEYQKERAKIINEL